MPGGENITGDVQIFATDIDAKAIEKPVKGSYLKNIAADVGPEQRLERFFVEEGPFTGQARIRESVMFAEQNVLRDPPFSTWICWFAEIC
jgi:two-component system, chemotaxis family, CheB/CheR fusion protein